MDNNEKKKIKKTTKRCEDNNNSQKKDSLGLDRFSYAEYVLLSSTISYAIAEELNDTDLSLLLAFLGMVTGDLAMIITKKGIEKAKKDTQAVENIVIDTTVQDISEEVIISDLGRKSKKNKIRKNI